MRPAFGGVLARRNALLLVSLILSTAWSTAAFAQVDVTATLGTPSASYTTLQAAFAAINAGTQGGVVTIGISGSTTETATAVLNASGSGSASYTSITISPTGGAARTISGGIAAGSPMIDLNGADYVTFDGLNSGGNSLTISNTTVSATSITSTIRFIGGATNNTITRCSVLGSGTMSVATNGANIFFSTDANTANGNDNNTISNCMIGPAGANLPTKGILGNGSQTTTAIGNSGIVINNNDIYDYFGAAVTSAGVAVNDGCNTWTITNNRFYQTAPRTWTTGALHNAIYIASASATSGAQGMTITGNIIGYASSTQTGTYTLTGSAGTFRGIQFSGITGGTISSINNNTVARVSLTGVTSSGTSSSAPFMGIYVQNGLVNTNGNTIGSQSATGSLVFATTSAFAADVNGIFNFSVDAWTVNNNLIGGITASNAGTGAASVYGLRYNTSSSVATTVSGNTVGGSVANSLQSTSTAAAAYVQGILATTSNSTVTGNTIRNLTAAGGGIMTTPAVGGIVLAGTSVNNTVSQNTIHSLSSTNATTIGHVTGIMYRSSSGANLVERNLIHSLSVASASAVINGIYINAGTATYQNNMIRLGRDAAGTRFTAGCAIYGIYEAVGTDNMYFNSVYIGGTDVGGASNTYAFRSAVTVNTRNYLNNIFWNNRSNGAGTGKHYAIAVGGSAPNPAGLTSNYNDLLADGTGGILGVFNAIDQATIGAWRTATGQDGASLSANPQFINPNGSAATGDIHVSLVNPTPIEGVGLAIGSVTNDYDGQLRASFTPTDIGADCDNFLSPPVIAYTPLGNTCSLMGVTLTATITDASGVPTAGIGLPVLYWNISGGAWSSATATWGGGSSYSFTFGSGVVVGDVVSYYIVAQDNATPPNVGSQPGGASGLTPDPPAAATPPASPSTYTILTTLAAGTYSIPGFYATLTAAVADYNSKCMAGPIVFELAAGYSSAGETFPITINANPDASATNTLTIRPAAGETPTISGSLASGALIKLAGADWVIIDGSNSGGTDRSLTITNSGTTAPCAIWLSSLGAGAGATNNTVKNCNINTSSATLVTAYALAISGSTIASQGGDNDGNTVQNNAVSSSNVGVYANGAAAVSAGGMDNLVVAGNAFSSATTLSPLYGVQVGNALSAAVRENTFNLTTSAATAPVGISIESNVSGSTVTANRITAVVATNTGGYGGRGITVGTGTASSNITVANNFVAGVNGSNYSSFGNSSAMGIGIGLVGNSTTLTTTCGGVNLYHNSVNMAGTYSYGASCLTAGLYVGSGASALDIRNNIFVNSLSNTNANGSGSKNYAVYSAATNAAYSPVISYNDYYVSGTQGVLGYLGGDQTTLAAFNTAFTGNPNTPAYNVVAAFTAVDLHIPAATTTLLESGGVTGTGVAVDIDNEARPGPPGSVNGGATAPDVGADEFDGTPVLANDMAATAFIDPTNGGIKPLDVAFSPQASFTNLGTEAQTNVTVRYRIVGPLPGTDEVYNQTATIASIASMATTTVTFPDATLSTSGSYTIYAASGLTGDQRPANDQITGSMSVLGPLSGTYTVGMALFNQLTGADLTFEPRVRKVVREVLEPVVPATGADVEKAGADDIAWATVEREVEETTWVPMSHGEVYEGALRVVREENPGLPQYAGRGVYPTITAAVADLNGRGVGGPVTFLLTDATYPSETFPITVNVSNPPATATNTVTICPNAGVTATVSGSVAGGALIKLNGADYIIIDGSNSGGTDRSLTFTNTATMAPCAIWIASLGNGAGATNNVVKNCNINTSAATTATAYGVSVSGATISAAGGDNDNVTVQNNAITSSNIGVYAKGNAAVSDGGMDNLSVIGNAFTTSTTLYPVYGVEVSAALNASVSLNTLNLTTSYAGQPVGISIESNVSNSSVTSNQIQSVVTTSTGGWGGRGITVGTGTTSSGITLANNFVAGVNGSNYSSFGNSSAMGIGIGVLGNSQTLTTICGGVNLYHNSVNMAGSYSYGGACVTAGLYVGSAASALDIRNNIFVNSLSNTDASGSGSKNYAVYSAATNAAYSPVISYNDYYVSGTQGVLGYLGGDRTTLAAFNTAFTGNPNTPAYNVVAAFTTPTDLHIPDTAPPTFLESGGAAGTGILVDIDNETRPGPPGSSNGGGTAPDVGADEFDGTPVAANDMAATAFVEPVSGGTEAAGVAFAPRASFTNAGTEAQTYVTVRYRIVGPAPSSDEVYNQTETIASIASLETTTVTFPSATVSTAGMYTMYAAAELVGDQVPANDQITGTFEALGPLCGTYAVGTGQPAPFNTLTGAVARLNMLGVSCAVVFELTSSSYTTPAETFPIVINAIAGASATNTITIRPASGQAPTITGNLASGALIKLNGADYVTIDGSNSGGTDRSLTLTNTATTSPCAVWIASLGNGAGATNDVVKNCKINTTGATTAIAYGIQVTGTMFESPGGDNDDVTIRNNAIASSNIGVYANGNAGVSAGGMDNLVVAGNAFTSSTTLSLLCGVRVANALNASVSGNTFNLTTSAATAPVGISIESNVSNSSVTSNQIQSVVTTSTAGRGGRGITVGTGTTSSNITVANNFIAGVNGSNNSTFGSSSAMGIGIGLVCNSPTLTTTCGGVNLYHNSVNMHGTYSYGTSCLTAGLYVGSGASALDILNNIFVNSLNNTHGSGTGSKNYAVYSAAGNTAYMSIRNNDYYVSGTQGVLGYLGGDQTTLAAFNTAFTGNAGTPALNIIAPFASSTNLHLSVGTLPTQFESGGMTGTGVAVDIDNETRPGPAGSGNGGALAPDVGADEFDGVPPPANDMAATAFVEPVSGGTEVAGVAFAPRASFTNAGTAAQTNVTVRYRIVGPAPSSDEVYNQTATIASIANLETTTVTFPSATVSTGGMYTMYAAAELVGDQVPANDQITGTFEALGALCGTYAVGTGQPAPFNTLTAAIARLNMVGVSCAVDFRLTDPSYTTPAETFPIVINAIAGASATNTITIRPAASQTPTISGSVASGALIKLNGADYVTIDGSNSGGTDRSLTLTNSAPSAPCAIWIASLGNGAGATNDVVKNCNINTSAATSITAYGISVSGTTISSGGGDNDDVTIQNNAVNSSNVGVYARGNAADSAGGMDNLVVAGNAFTSSTTLSPLYGVRVAYALNASVRGNTFSLTTSAAATPVGISIESYVSGSSVTANRITAVVTTNTTGRGGRGITVGTSTTSSDVTIANNFIAGVSGSNNGTFGSSSAIGIGIGLVGNSSSLTTTCGGVNLYHNSVNMAGDYSYGASCLTTGLYVGSWASALDIRNNIFVNSLNNTHGSGTGSKNYAVYSAATNTAYTPISDNDYYVSGTQGVLGYLGGDQTTLAAFNTAFTGNPTTPAYNVVAAFTTPTDLHIPATAPPTLLESGGAVGMGILVDIDNETRPGPPGSVNGGATAPDVGADEFDGTPAPANDMAATAFITPTSGGGAPTGVAFAPQASFTNVGTAAQTDVTVRYRIVGPAPSSDEVYNQTATIASIARMETTTAAFPSATLSTGGMYTMYAAAELVGDQVPANDQIIGTFEAAAPLCGTYLVGSGQPVPFNTLTGAIARLNMVGVSCAVDFRLTDPSYTTPAETFPIVINVIAGASASNTVTIRPASGQAPTITGNLASGALIKLNGADYVTIDGSSSGGTDRSLTITNTATMAPCAVWIASLGNGAGATNDVVKNCNINTSAAATATAYGVSVSGATIGSIGGDNDDVTIQNNVFASSNIGVYASGNAAVSAGGMDDLVVAGNAFSSSTTLSPLYGVLVAYALNATVSGNTFNLTTSAATTPVGISIESYVSGSSVTANRITGVVTTNTGGWGGRGITVGTGATSSDITVANNFIAGVNGSNYGDFGNSSAMGIGIGVLGNSGSLTTTCGGVNLYHNSVNMYGDYSYEDFCLTAGLYVGSAASALDIRNNIFVNSLSNTSAGWSDSKSYAVFSDAASTAYTPISDNDYYVSGTQGVLGYLGGDHTTLAEFNTAFTGNAGTAALNIIAPFTSSTDLHLSVGTTPTQFESGGAAGMGILVDIDNQTRPGPPGSVNGGATAPDVGADEFDGVPLDLTPPTIWYEPLANTSDTGNRNLPGVTITDGSGVNGALGTRPRVYYKELGDANTFVDNTNATNGWKYAEASGSTSPFDFTIDYSLLGSGAPSGGDVIQYFVVAQDLASTPRVGINSGTFAAQPASVALTAAAFPLTGAIRSYTIVGAPLSGDYVVGIALFRQVTGRDVTFEPRVKRATREALEPESPAARERGDKSRSDAFSKDQISWKRVLREVEEVTWVPMENSREYEGSLCVKRSEDPDLPAEAGRGVYATITAAVADLNLRGVSGPVRFLLSDASYPSESFPITVNVANTNVPTATNTVTIKPNTGVTATVSGASDSAPIFKVLATNYVAIDGSNSVGGTTRDLTLENTSAASPIVVWFGSSGATPITNGTLENCVVRSGSTSGWGWAVMISDGAMAGSAGYFSTMGVRNNKIERARYGVIANGGTTAQNGSDLTCVGNELNTSGPNAIGNRGLYMAGVNGGLVANNDIGNFDPTPSENDRGIWLDSGTTNVTVNANRVHDLGYTGTAGYGGQGIVVSTEMASANVTISNNMLFGMTGDSDSYLSYGYFYSPAGIYAYTTNTMQGGIGIYDNSIFLYGNTVNRNDAYSVGIALDGNSAADVTGNNVENNLGRLSTTGAGAIAIALRTNAAQLTGGDFNNLYCNSTGGGTNLVGRIDTSDYATMAAWRTASGRDANSISADPQYLGNADLHIRQDLISPVSNAGTTIAGVTTDYDGDARGATPDIGADEFTIYTLTTAVVGSGSVTVLPLQAAYAPGTEVTLSALASGGWTFDHWTGDAGGSVNPLIVVMDANKSITAVFVGATPPGVSGVHIANLTLAHTDEFAKDTDDLELTATVTDISGLSASDIVANFSTLLDGGATAVPAESYVSNVATWTTALADVILTTDGLKTVTITATNGYGLSGVGSDEITVDNTAPDPVQGFVASPGHGELVMSWSDPTELDDHYYGLMVWYREWDGYPEYDPPAPQYPATPGGAGMTLAYDGDGLAMSWVHPVVERDILYASAFASDYALNYSAVGGSRGAGQGRSTNYWLGDVANTADSWVPDGLVTTNDINKLAGQYGSAPTGDFNTCDVGPTDDHSRLGIPQPDDYLNFEDLVIFAMNYGVVSPRVVPFLSEPASEALALSLNERSWSPEGELQVALSLDGNVGQVKALSSVIAFDPGELEFVSARLSDAMSSPLAETFFWSGTGKGTVQVDLAVLGTGVTIGGSGDVAVLTFRSVGTEYTLGFDGALLRGRENEDLAADLEGLESQLELPMAFRLSQNVPNPFNPRTVVAYEVPQASEVAIRVHDVTGRLVRTLVDGKVDPGRYSAQWDGKTSSGESVGSGVYFCVMEAPAYHATHKMILLR